jgi:hypothetical protein
MNRSALTAAAGAAGALALVGALAGGYELGSGHVVTHTISRTVTATVTRTPKPVTRWRTRTVVKPAAASAPSLPCQWLGGQLEPGVAVQGLAGDTTCAVTLISPMGASHLGEVQFTDPAGHASVWNLANPAG